MQQIHIDLGVEYLEIVNRVDLTTQSNLELAMRMLSSDFATDDKFFTDLNGYQMIRRKRSEKLTLQGNFYPMPGTAFLQIKEK